MDATPRFIVRDVRYGQLGSRIIDFSILRFKKFAAESDPQGRLRDSDGLSNSANRTYGVPVRQVSDCPTDQDLTAQKMWHNTAQPFFYWTEGICSSGFPYDSSLLSLC